MPRAAAEWTKLGACLTFLLALALRVFRLGYQSIWWDEGYSIAISSASLAEATRSTAADIHPPLYYYLLHFWMQLAGQSEFAVRFLSVVLGVLLVALIWGLGSRLLGPRLGTLGAFLAAVSPLYVTYAQETRMYTLETVLGLGSALLLFRLLRDTTRSRLVWSTYVLVTALALYADYFSIEVVIFENVFVAGWVVYNWRRRPDAPGFFLRWMLSQAAVALLFVPWLGIALGQVSGYGFGAATAPPFFSLLANIWRMLSLGTLSPVRGEAYLLYVVGAILLSGLAIHVLKRRREGEAKAGLLFLLCYLLPPLAALALALEFRPFYHPRYFLVVTPPYYLLLAAALGGLWSLWRGLGALGCAALIVSSALALGGYYFDPTHAKDDTRSTMAFVNQEATEDDVVLWMTPHPYQYYYRGKAAASTLKPNPVATADELSELIRGKKRVFWLDWRHSDLDPWKLAPFLLEKYGRKLGERDFAGYKVLWYATPPQGVYETPRVVDREVNFDDSLLLTGLRVEGKRGAISSGEPVWVTLTWRGLKRTPLEDLKAYVHVKDSGGTIVGQDDRFLYDLRRAPTRFWREGDVAYTFASPVIKPGTPRGKYLLEVGVYSEKTMQRLKIVAAREAEIGASIQVERSFAAPPSNAQAIRHTVGRDFGQLTLLGYDLDKGEEARVLQGGMFSVALLWKAREKPAFDHRPGLMLRDEQGNTFGERRLHPASYPTTQWEAGEVVVDKRELLAPAGLKPGPYELMLVLGDSPPYPLGRVQVAERPRSFEVPALRYPLSAKVGEGIEFLGFDIQGGSYGAGGPLLNLRPGQEFTLVLYWRARVNPERAFIVFTHVADSEGRIWGQHDAPPDNGASPTNSWLEGQVVTDRHRIALKKEAPSGGYTLSIGMYDPAADVRLSVEGRGNRIDLGKVEVAGN